jgi:hypothetical protein
MKPKGYKYPPPQPPNYDAQLCSSFRLLIKHLGKRKYRRSHATILVGGVRYNLLALEAEQHEMLYEVNESETSVSSIDPERFRRAGSKDSDIGNSDGGGIGESQEHAKCENSSASLFHSQDPKCVQEWGSEWDCFSSQKSRHAFDQGAGSKDSGIGHAGGSGRGELQDPKCVQEWGSEWDCFSSQKSRHAFDRGEGFKDSEIGHAGGSGRGELQDPKCVQAWGSEWDCFSSQESLHENDERVGGNSASTTTPAKRKRYD